MLVRVPKYKIIHALPKKERLKNCLNSIGMNQNVTHYLTVSKLFGEFAKALFKSTTSIIPRHSLPSKNHKVVDALLSLYEQIC